MTASSLPLGSSEHRFPRYPLKTLADASSSLSLVERPCSKDIVLFQVQSLFGWKALEGTAGYKVMGSQQHGPAGESICCAHVATHVPSLEPTLRFGRRKNSFTKLSSDLQTHAMSPAPPYRLMQFLKRERWEFLLFKIKSKCIC